MELRIELPSVLINASTENREGLIELCPEEYDMGNIGEMLASVLAECEELVLGSVGTISDSKIR